MKKLTPILASLLCVPVFAIAMGQPPADDKLTKSETQQVADATKATSLITVTPYDKPLSSTVENPYKGLNSTELLNKLEKKQPLNRTDLIHLEAIYGTGYVGEEELDATNTKIYEYAKTILPETIRKQVEKINDDMKGP